MSIVEVKVPDIGDFKEVEVIELMVKPGDTIKVDQSLVTVESDKASMEIPSSHAGVVKEIKINVGDKVAEGSLVLLLEEAGGAADASADASAAAPAAEAAPAAAPAAPAPAAAEAPAAAPAASGGLVDVTVPDIGDFKEVEVIELMVKVGDTIKVDQSLLTVESDKASMEIPSSMPAWSRKSRPRLATRWPRIRSCWSWKRPVARRLPHLQPRQPPLHRHLLLPHLHLRRHQPLHLLLHQPPHRHQPHQA